MTYPHCRPRRGPGVARIRRRRSFPMGGGIFSIELHKLVSTLPTVKKPGTEARYNCRTLSLRGNWDDGVKNLSAFTTRFR